MSYGGNMPDWHQYNSMQPIGSEVPPVGQNANHSPIFGPTLSPRRLNGPTFSPEGLNKPQNDTNFNPRNFQQSPNTLNRPNVPPETSPMGSAAHMSSCNGPYGAPSPRNTMIEGTSSSLESRNISSGSLNEAIGQRNHQISINRPAVHLDCSTMNGSMGLVGQRNTPTNLQGPLPTSSRQGSGSYIACKLPCCNPDPNISYQSWEKFGPYPPNMPYRDTGYPVDNRRFSNDCENREQLGSGAYNIDPRRNFPDYKYRKDSIIPRTYAHPTGVIQNYPIQNYNFPADYQKYPAYPIKEYLRDSPIANPQNPGILKYQEQSVIVQQKYFTKQIQYQNGIVPKSIVPNNMAGSVISRAQNPYFNPQLARDFPRSYADSNPLANRGMQTANPIHAAYPKYQMYQQKIAMQRFSMENHLRELTRIPGYQSHPKYQESILRYRELLRLQQTVDYQSTAQDTPKVVTSQVNDEIPPINLQFDQNGVLINSSFAPAGFSNSQSPINLQNSKIVQSISNTEVGPLNLQQSMQFKTQASIDNHIPDQESSLVSQPKLSHKNDRQYSTEKDQLQVEKYVSESHNVPNSDNGKISSMHQRNSSDFADKPELDVRQFLANWDESEDEDGTNANLPDVVLSNSASGVVEYEDTKAVPENPEEAKNCSETEDCRSRDDCGMFENTQNETKPSNSTDNPIYQCDLPPGGESIKSVELDSHISDSGKKHVRTGTVIQPTSTRRENKITSHIMENMACGQAPQSCVKLLHRETKSSDNTESQELTDTVKGDIIVKKESLVEEETITSIKEHINAYNHEADTGICSSIGEIVKNNDNNRSSSGKESSENIKLHFSSDEDLSESDDSNSMDTDSISSFITSPQTIKGTEIHVDAQELSAIPVASKNDSEILDSTNLQKQNSFTSEESHNPDDISLPDLPTSECTPISTTLNTPIHSDSEESSEPVIDLTTPANPIEIIQNSPMLSFTHSPIKMEPYEHLDENDLTNKVSHDALDFEYQASNSCDNDYEKLTDGSSHTTEQYNTAQNDEDSFDSDCVEIFCEKADPKVKINTIEVKTKNDVADNTAVLNGFAFNKESVMTADKSNTTVNADHQPWPLVTLGEVKHQISNNTEHQDTKSDADKLETLSEIKDGLSVMSKATKDHLRDDIAHISSAKNYHSINRWHTKYEMENGKSSDNMTALNLVKDEIQIKSDSIKVTDETTNLDVAKATKRCPSNSNEGINFKQSNQSACNSLMENEVIFPSTEHSSGYVASSQEDKIYTESIENQSNFNGSLNIPLIPGEDFEEPKMPVLPMEGNCLTKIIKNTSPITDLDVLGSDDEKLDKMDEIWMEVGGVETVGKVTDVNIDTYTECGDGFNREKNLSSRNKLRILKNNDWKCLKNSIKPKDPSKLSRRVYDESQEKDLKSSAGKKLQVPESSNLETTRKESEPMEEDFQSAIISGTDNTAAILQEKHNFTKVPIISKITSNSSIREDGKQNHDMCLENNATEVLKCQEKANHINDIATKLLENARLFEPELQKIGVQKKEISSVKNSRDSSKNRIKLLKEFRKVKNKIIIDRPVIESAKSVDALENNAVSTIKNTEQYEEVDTETMDVNNEIKKIENVFTGIIENVMHKFDSLIVNSINTLDSQVTQKVNVNTEENTLDTISTNITIPEEKLKQILTDDKATLKVDDTIKESCNIVNMEDSITGKGSNSVNSHDSFDIKVVSPIEEDINECAINLSKSSNDFGLLQTVIEKGCVTNDSNSFYTSGHIKIEKRTEIESKSNDETIYTATKDDSLILSQSSYSEDSGLCTEIVEEGDNTQEIHHINVQNVMEDNYKYSTASTCTNSAKECILKENIKRKIDEESTRTDEHEEPEKSLSILEKMEDFVKFSKYQEKMVDSIFESYKNSTDVLKTNDGEADTFVLEQNGHSELNELVVLENKEDQKPAKEAVDSEVMCNAGNVWNNIDGTLMVNEKESTKLTESLNDGEKKTLSSLSAEEEICSENLESSLQNMSNVSEEKDVEAVKNCIEIISSPRKERNIIKLPVVQQLMESEPMIDNDCSINIRKCLEDLDVITDIPTESKIICNDLEIVEKPLIVNESLTEMQLEESTQIESLQNTNLEVVSGTDKSLGTVDATFEAFGLENSFNYDFNNFDVAPNNSNTEDTDQSNNWKYSKAYARFEDCERYKNPDNFVNPILTSLETLDNLNTVPVYTTKDGKITYSPNPKFTYRALIMEAREREGYPALRKSYCGNPRAQESLYYGKNQTSFRKRKNSEAYSYSGSCGKKNYFEYYELREHGEPSMKNLPEPRNRSYFSQNKYSHQSREGNSHHLTPHNSVAGKKNTTEKIGQEKVLSKYKYREGCTIFDEHNKRKNVTSESFKSNNKKQYKQSTEQSASNSVWSRSKQNVKYNQNSSETVLSRPETNKITDNKKNLNLERTVSTEKYVNNLKNGNRSKDVQPIEKFTSASNENEHVTKFSTNILPTKSELSLSSDTLFVRKIFPDIRVENSNHETIQGLTIKPGLFASEWEDNCEILTVQRRTSCELKIPTEHLLDEIKEVCDKETKELYDEVDDICRSKSDINERKSDDTNLSENKCVIPSDSVKSLMTNETFEEPGCNQEKFNIDKDESTVNNAENKDASYSIPVEVIRTAEQKILELEETPNKNEPEASLNEQAESTLEDDKFNEPLHYTNGEMNLNSTQNCTLEKKDEIHIDTENEVATSNQISEVQDNLVALKFNDKISHSSEESYSIKETDEIESNEQKMKSFNLKPEINKDGTSIKSLQLASNNSLSLKIISEYENTSKPQSQSENYIAYSPSNESPEDTKIIPKLVIKKADSLSFKNVCLGPLLAASHDLFAEKVEDTEEYSSKVSVHPKIPKIVIRNAKSRPSTPSIEEVTEKKIFSVTTKEDSKVPKVKIRFEEKRPQSPAVSSNENVSKTDSTETKIPKMKIKLEDRLPKVIIENLDMESCGSNEEVQKTIPRIKIKKFKGALRQIVDTQILPVSIPRMFIYTELERDRETTLQILTKKEVSTSDNNLNPVILNSIEGDQKTVKDAELKKIPKLKIKRQGSGCSVDLNRKRHNVSPIQSELKKVKKSSKLAEPNDIKQFNKLSVGSQYRDSLKRLDTFSVEQSYELAISENVKYTTATQSSESVRGEQLKSIGGNISETPEEIPKVIIKRASPSAEFKCELSKVRRDAIIKNKRWQPEVKLHRSWVLDCMAKDLNLDKLRLKLATPDSILKKCSPQKQPELGESHVKYGNQNTNRSEKKIFRSKSTSELVPAHESIGILVKDDVKQLNETNPGDLPRELISSKRCKSDLGSTFPKYSENLKCKKKLRHNNHSSTIQLTSKPMLNYADDFTNSSSVQFVEADTVVEKYRVIKDLNTTLHFKQVQSNNEAVHLMETSERSQDKTLGENMHSKAEIFTSKITSLLRNNETPNSSFVDLDLNSKILFGSTTTKNSSNSDNITNVFVNDLKMNEIHKVNDSHSHYSATQCKDRFEVSKDSIIVKNTNVNSVKRHTKSGKNHTKEIRTQVTEKDKTMEFKNNGTSSMTNMSTNCIDEEKTRQIFSTSTAVHDEIDQNQIVTNNTGVPAKSVTLQTPTPDINMLKRKSEICAPDALNTADNLEIFNCKNNIHKLDINDNSDGNLREVDENNAVSENLISCIDTVEQENTSTLNENVLITSVINKSESTNLDTNDVQDPNIYVNPNNRSDDAIDNDSGNSVEKVESFEESQTIREILSASPSLSQSEVEIQLCPDVIEENGVCLYHEDAIPTQFELELEIIDNIVPDPLEVPMPQNNQPDEEFQIYSGDELNEDSHQSSRILNNSRNSVNIDDAKSETDLPEENNFQVCSVNTYQREVFAYPAKQDTILSVDIDKRNVTSSARMRTTVGFDSNVETSSSYSDLLVKEVLAAKERLRKCLVKSKSGSRLKFKTRPKTAAEKKQGSSFDLNTLVTSEDSSTKLENHSLNNIIAEPNSSKQMDTNFSSSNNNEKFVQNQTTTEFEVNKMKSERKHSKGSKNNLMQKKYSSLPTNIQKYTNLAQVEGHLMPKHSSIDIKDRVEFSKGETTISLKNSKYLIKNHSCSDARKKMSEFINSKDSKCRSKSSRHDFNSKYVGKSKSSFPNTVVKETSSDIGQSEEKPVSDAAKHKYKSLKTSLDQNVKSMTDKTKLQLYKIPKITQPTNPENEILTEELRGSRSNEARMPILEPQVDLNGGLEVSELSSDRETSRSPPVITNQNSRADYESTTWDLECQVSLNQEKEVSLRQTSSFLEKEVLEAIPSCGKETTVADIVNDMAYHEKATIRHRRYCTLCERWFPTVARYKRHLSGYQHRHTELTQRRTIHALFTLFTGRPCPRLQPPGVVRINCEPGELTPLQIAVQGVTKESNTVNGNIEKPTREDNLNMKWPSLSLVLSGIFLAYITYSIYTLSLLFVPPPCVEGRVCLTSFLNTRPQLRLHMYVSTMSRPIQKELTHVYSEGIFNYGEAHDIQVTLPIPRKTRENGTLFLHLLITPYTENHGDTYSKVIKDPTTVYTRIKMTQYIVPEIAAFNLLGDEKASKNKERAVKPVSHLKSQVTFTMITDDIKLPAHNLPLELARDISITRDGMFLPIVNYDFLQTRHRDLVKILPQNETMNVTVFYTPISIGKLRLILHVEAAMQGLKSLGFSDKDVDEVKGIFADTNVYLLGGTIFIAAIHLLFDFLAFKNDVSFWRGKNNLAGLSVRTVVWRAFSQAVIFLYLLDEQSSMLVLIPAGIGTIIEFWKSKKILRAEIVTGQGWLPYIKFEKIESSSAEERTRKFDAESMKYLSYLLYPLVAGGAVYSLLYQPHKSWYSWSINSLVNGVYAFGFLFMLPQLFVNYKLKSVAHLPWRAFMYKAFNTFIDDIFAFIITMPTAHRVACFRDDAVFLIYLYQRWLYPVDKSRRDDAVSMDETPTECKMDNKKKN